MIITGELPELPNPRYKMHGKCKQCGWCCLNEDCEYLKQEEDGRMICSIFGHPDRPQMCANFPAAPPILHLGCGYYFTDSWENDRVLRPREV